MPDREGTKTQRYNYRAKSTDVNPYRHIDSHFMENVSMQW